MAFGVTPTGFNAKTLLEIQQEINVALVSLFGAEINLDSESVFGQLKDIFAEREALLWELAEAVYNSQYPNSASNAALDDVVTITGITRDGATFSKIERQIFRGTATTVIPIGTQVAVLNLPDNVYATDEEVTIQAAQNEIQKIFFLPSAVAGTWDLLINLPDGTLDATIIALDFNVSAAALEAFIESAELTLNGNIDVTGDNIVGYSIEFINALAGVPGTFDFVADPTNLVSSIPAQLVGATTTVEQYGGPVVEVGMTALVAGSAIFAPADTLSDIITPIAGLDETFNDADATLGKDLETDAELRLRRNQTIANPGCSTLDAIRAALLDLDGVSDAFIVENDTLIPVTGLFPIPPYTGGMDERPGKSFESFVTAEGGLGLVPETSSNSALRTQIAEVILANKAAGIQTFGFTSEDVTDSQGVVRTIFFSEPIEVPIFLELDLTTNSEFPVDGVALVTSAMVIFGTSLGPGQDVIVFPQLIGALNNVPGIVDVVVRIATNASPTTDANIPIDDGSSGSVQISTWDSSDITIVIL